MAFSVRLPTETQLAEIMTSPPWIFVDYLGAARHELAAEAEARGRNEDPRAAARMLGALLASPELRLLAWLFGQPDRKFYLKQLVRKTGCGVGTVHATLARLEACGLLHSQWDRGRKQFQVEARAPVHAELCALFRKGCGLAGPLREALAPVEGRLDAAFVYEGRHRNPGLAEFELLAVANTPPDIEAAITEADANSTGEST